MTRTFRFAAALAVACLAFLGLAGVAGAQDYSGATLTLDKLQVGPNGEITAFGDNFVPNADVSIIVASTPTEVGPARTDGTGRFILTFLAPTDPGVHTVTARDGVNTVTVNFEVLAAGTGTTPGGVTPGGALPYTGNDTSLPLAQIGVGLLAVGAVIALTVRKRSQGLAHAKVDA